MKDNFKTIETTFGQIKIYKDNDEPVKTLKTTTKATKNVEKQIQTSTGDENNFFGLDTNYFDKSMLDEYKINNEIQKSNKTSDEEIPLKIEKIDKNDMNFIDGVYFENLTKISQNDSNLVSPVGQTFNTEHIDDANLGNIRDFIRKDIQKDEIQESIPIIHSKNLTENETKKLTKPKIRKTDSSHEKSTSQHKILQEDIPDWNKLTLDESAEILKKHICYHNEEEGIFAIDKPYGLPSIRGENVHLSVSKLLPALEKMLKLNYRLLMCNRLDEFTTGVMLFATNPDSARKIRTYFDSKKIIKQYVAITKHVPKDSIGEINIPLIRRSVNGVTRTYLSPNYDENTQFVLNRPHKDVDKRKNAITKYRVIDSNNNSSLMEIQPLTGFQHQIRAHLAYGLGCPILGDHKYSHHIKLAPQKLPDEILKFLKIRQSKARYVPMHLHSNQIILQEFHQNKNVFIKAKLPIHFVNNMKRLKLKF
ncbi:unnamed protein product [Brachionus calyciflorus]|uniref:Pseudouridylate synthase RPUSD4, mitochondrial n=1 Tax=Brachionus calyciflorus TaxID=104777 RepID=A0A813XDZ8_9BILA|nr:unnamed protein product [Brachionus calyciflorus]